MTPRKSSRRDFLRGKAAVDALADLPLPASTDSTPVHNAAEAGGGYLVRVGRRAMACEFEVLLNAGQYADGTETAVAALDLVDRLESQLTVFQDTSEVSRVNQSAFDAPMEVEPRLFELLQLAIEFHRRTAGAYDITSGPLSKVWGFYRRAGRMPDAAEIDAALERVGSHRLELDPVRRTIRFLAPGMEINLGSIGKGFALDRSAELLEAARIDDFLIHGGHSSILGRGSHGSADAAGWWVGLRDPLHPEQRLGEIRLTNRALATSGTGAQFFYHEGRRYGHILDPRTGRPAESVLSTTVLAPTAAEADALSTAFYVMGPSAALDYCRTHRGLSAVIVTPGDRTGMVDIATVGLEADEWRPMSTA